jgi:hypothetical protein
VETVAKDGNCLFRRFWSFVQFEIVQSNVIKRASIAVTFYTHIREVLDSNLSRDAGILD